MTRLRPIVLVSTWLLAGSAALADQHFNDGKGATWDCAKDAIVHINASSGAYTFKGACKEVHVNGGSNTLAIENVSELHVNGASNTVTIAESNGEIHVNGSHNKVHWDKGSPKVKSNGPGNEVGATKPAK
jgi:phage baseplate assembly protein gpV